MRQTVIVLLAGVFSSSVLLSVHAQGGGGAPRGGPAAQQTRDHIVMGCIKPAGPGTSDLSITDSRGGLGGTFLLDAQDARLKPWVNDTVEIHGTVTPASGTAGPNAPMKLHVDTLFVLARGCKPAGGH